MDLEAYDDDGNLVVDVDRSELRHSTEKWDVRFIGPKLTIHEQERNIIFELVLHPPDGIEIRRALFSFEGHSLTVLPHIVVLPNENWAAGGVVKGLDAHRR